MSQKLDPREEDFYNPYSEIRDSLRKAETQNTETSNEAKTTDDINNLEQSSGQDSSQNTFTKLGKSAANGVLKVKNKSAAIAVILALVGGGGFMTVIFTPSLAVVAMKEALSSLNDQLHAVDVRSSKIIKAKFSSVSANVCGAVKVCQTFSKMSDKQVKDFEKNNSGTKIERTPENRIAKVDYENDKTKITVKTPDDLEKSLDKPDFKSSWTSGYNPEFKTLSDPTTKKVLLANKVTKNEKISGKNDTERQKNLNKISGGLEDTGAKAITTVTDENGKTRYLDESGNEIDEKAYKNAQAMEKRVSEYVKNGGTMGTLKNIVGRTVQIDFAADMSCTVFNTIRHVSALSKMVKQAQAIRYAMALVLTPADRIKAGDAEEALTNFTANTLMATQPNVEVLDESKLGEQADSDTKVPTKTESIGNAFDSKGFRLANGETVGPLDTREARFSVAGAGSPAVLDKTTDTIAGVVTGGNKDPNVISKACKYIQSPFVRVGAFAAGIATGIATFGASTIVLGVSSIALQLAAPLVESQLGEMVAGDAFNDIEGDDSGNASYVGMAGINDGISQKRAMTPVTTSQGKDYAYKNQKTAEYYASIKRYDASNTPFDINNPYSFIGSVLMAVTPTMYRASSGGSAAILNTLAFAPSSIINILQPRANAMQSNYYGHCNDMMYKSLGIDAGPFCEVRYYMDDKQLNMDPLVNARWMADTGNIDPNSDSGEAKDNGAEWNYVKFLGQCVNRTEGWGEVDIENPQSADGSNCLKPEYKELNSHFSVYTMDKSLQEGMDKDDTSIVSGIGGGFADSLKNPVSENGWSYPVKSSTPIATKFGEGDSKTDKNGITFGKKNSTAAYGQPIFAAYSGTVMAAGPASIINTNTDFGNWIVIEHEIDGKKISTIYGHMANDGVYVKPGDKVSAGQQIGAIGSNRTQSDAAYLSFQVYDGSPLSGGTPIDPLPLVRAARIESETSA